VVGQWSKLSGLKLTLETVELLPHSLRVSPQFERHTTVIRFGGAGAYGLGEDVVYDTEEQLRFRGSKIDWPRGEFDLESFSNAIDELVLFDRAPQQQAYHDYRRWAVEAAALDLALAQSGRKLAEVLERSLEPVNFAVSTGLGNPPALDKVEELIRRVPGARFKLDANSEWSQELLDRLAEMGVVDVVDFKGAYKGTIVDTPPDAALYRRVAETLPQALLEDPAWNAETAEALEPFRDRISWDAPIHGIQNIEALPFPPRVINIKPSRFGKLNTLCETYDYCRLHGIGMYGGGQFELDEGRLQIQTLASLFHSSATNDVSPIEYHQPDEHEKLPSSPLQPAGRWT